MNTECFADMSSRGPQFPDEIKANWILAKRFMRTRGYSFSQFEGRMSVELHPYLNRNGLPAERTIQDWEKSNPGFPEKVLTDGMIRPQAILPWLRPNCFWEGFHASQQQGIPSVRQSESGVSLAKAVGAVALVVYAISRALQRRPAGQGLRLTNRRKPI